MLSRGSTKAQGFPFPFLGIGLGSEHGKVCLRTWSGLYTLQMCDPVAGLASTGGKRSRRVAQTLEVSFKAWGSLPELGSVFLEMECTVVCVCVVWCV